MIEHRSLHLLVIDGVEIDSDGGARNRATDVVLRALALVSSRYPLDEADFDCKRAAEGKDIYWLMGAPFLEGPPVPLSCWTAKCLSE